LPTPPSWTPNSVFTQPGQLHSAVNARTWPNESHPAVQEIQTFELPFLADKDIRKIQRSPSSFVAKFQESCSYNEETETDDANVHSGAMLKRKYGFDSKLNKGEKKTHFHESKSQSRRSSSNESPIQAKYNRSNSPELYDWKRPKTTNKVQGLEQKEKRESRRSTADKRSRGHETPEREEHSPKHSSKKLKYGEYERIPNRERHAWEHLSPDKRVYAEESSPPDRVYVSPPDRVYVSPPDRDFVSPTGREYVSRSDWEHYSPPNEVHNISTDEKYYYSAPAKERSFLPDSERYSRISSGEVGHSGGKSLPLVVWQDTQDDTDGKDYYSAPKRESSFLSDKEQYYPISSNEEGHSGGRSLPLVGRRDTKNDPDGKDYYSAPDREHSSLLDRIRHYSLSSNDVSYSGGRSQPLVRQQNTQNYNIPADREDNYSASDRAIFSSPHREQYSSSYGKEYSDSQRSSGKESHLGGRSPLVVSQRDTHNDRLTVDDDIQWKKIPDGSYTLEPQSSGETVQSVGLKTTKGLDGDTGRSETSYSIDLINSALVSTSLLMRV